MAELRWGLATHEGNVRPQNEDNAFADGRLFVVADGMGGHLAGEVASEMVVARLHDTFSAEATGVYNEDGSDEAANSSGADAAQPAATTADSTAQNQKPSATTEAPKRNPAGAARSAPGRTMLGRDDLVTAVAVANTEIFDESSANPDRSGMGTTVTAIAVVDDAIDDEVFAVANVGDSRIYRVRHERLRQITIDHSFVQELVAEGAITRAEARTHPRRNIVTRALGIESDVRVDSWTLPIVRGDRYVLCSDGLVDEVADDDITAILVANPDPQDAAERCVEAALDNGGRDNVTVVVVDVLAGLDPPEPTEEIEAIPAWDDGHDDMPTGEVPIITDELVLEEIDAAATATATAERPKRAPGAKATPDTTPSGGTPIPPNTPATMSRVEANRAAAAARANAKPPRRQFGASRFILTVGVAAVLILGAVVLTAWARSGYVIAFNNNDRVALYQGKEFLWFHPTEVGPYPERRDQLTERAISLVNQRPEFGSRASANSWAAEYLQTTTTTTTTTTTSTTAPAAAPVATTPPIDSVPTAPPVNTTSPPTTISTSGP